MKVQESLYPATDEHHTSNLSADRYNPLSGSRLPQTSQSHATLPDVSLISYSDNLAITQTSDLKEFTKPAGVTSSSYRDWDSQRWVAVLLHNFMQT